MTLLLSKSDIKKLITLEEAIPAIEQVFLAYSSNEIQLCPIVHADVAMGEFHIKAGGYKKGLLPYFTTKINGGFFSNATSQNLPNILGLIVLNSTRNGFPLAVLESSTITSMRTAAATAVAVKYLADPQSSIVTICGSGNQAYLHLKAVKEVMPKIEIFHVYSKDYEKSHMFAEEMSKTLKMAVLPADDLQTALNSSQICITCTSSKKYIIEKSMLPQDIFIAAIGADSPDKQELDPLIFKDARVVVDIKEQCASVGDLHHALKLNCVDQSKITELGDVVLSGSKLESHKGVTIFDSTGTAMQDTSLARIVYEKALKEGTGAPFHFFELD